MTVKVSKPEINVREKLAELDKPSGIAGEALLRADTVQEARDQLRVGRKNLIINGGMDVWQRGTSFTSIGNMIYGVDRFNTARAHQVNISRVASGVQGFKYAHRHTNVTAGVGTLYHPIENTGQFYAGQSVTLSYWARASEAITVRSCRVWDDAAYVTSYTTVDIDTSWKKFAVTQVINSNWAGTETAFKVQIWTGDSVNMSAGSWIETTGVQLELGKVATPFEHRSYGEELALCQRYFEQLATNGENDANRYNGIAWATNNLNVFIPFLVAKRSAPTVSITNNGEVFTGSWQSADSSSVTGTGLRGCTISIQKASAYTVKYGYFIRNQTITASAEL